MKLLEYKPIATCNGCGREIERSHVCDDCRKWFGYDPRGGIQRREFFVAAYFRSGRRRGRKLFYRVMTPHGVPAESGSEFMYEEGCSLFYANWLCRQYNSARIHGEYAERDRAKSDAKAQAINTLVRAAIKWAWAQDQTAKDHAAIYGGRGAAAGMDDVIERPLYVAAKIVAGDEEGKDISASRFARLESLFKFARRIYRQGFTVPAVAGAAQLRTDLEHFKKAVSALDEES